MPPAGASSRREGSGPETKNARPVPAGRALLPRNRPWNGYSPVTLATGMASSFTLA